MKLPVISSSHHLDQTKLPNIEHPVESLILRRWSPLSFADTPVKDADLNTLFTAASWAASSYNEQPWRFLVGRKGDDTWAKISASLIEGNKIWANAAPVLYVAVAKITFISSGLPNPAAAHDVGAACATLSLQATALGLYTRGMAGFDAEILRQAFHMGDDYVPVSCWALGYLGDPDTLSEKHRKMELRPRTRKPLSAFVFSDWEGSR
jgi:nitroreductase